MTVRQTARQVDRERERDRRNLTHLQERERQSASARVGQKPHKDARSSNPWTSLTVSMQVVNGLGRWEERGEAGQGRAGQGHNTA